MSSQEQVNSKRLNLDKATNFMRQYRDPQSRELKKLSANQFMEVWSHYDKDGKLIENLDSENNHINIVTCLLFKLLSLEVRLAFLTSGYIFRVLFMKQCHEAHI